MGPADGSRLRVACRRPAECGPEEIRAFARLLDRAFGASDRSARVGRAVALVFLEAGSELAGVAAIKTPDYDHRRGVFTRAGVALAGPPPRHELGWVVVDESHRGQGCSRLLAQAALEAAGQVDLFATSHTGNHAMHKTLERVGFTRLGRPWLSRRHQRELALFLRTAAPPG